MGWNRSIRRGWNLRLGIGNLDMDGRGRIRIDGRPKITGIPKNSIVDGWPLFGLLPELRTYTSGLWEL